MKNKLKKTFKTTLKIIIIIAIYLFFIDPIIWRIPIYLKINTLNLPENCETVYRTDVWFSDIYMPHVMGEKVVKCDLGLDEFEKYVLENNSVGKLKNISIYSYWGMSDDRIYNSEYDDNFDSANMTSEEKDKYILIKYWRKGIGSLFWYIVSYS